MTSCPSGVYLPVGILESEVLYRPVGIENFRTLFTYLPLPHEIDPTPIVARALTQGVLVAAPRVSGDDLAFHAIESADGPFEIGSYGIREPFESAPRVYPKGTRAPSAYPNQPRASAHTAAEASPSFPVVILVPGLAFTPSGKRLGRGKGYYDRFLASFLASYADRRAEILLVGACHEAQIARDLPVDGRDIPVDCILTEKNGILCI